jgi:hypothetical protein
MGILIQPMNDMARSIPNDPLSDSCKAWGSRIQPIFGLVLKLVDEATLEQFAGAVMRSSGCSSTTWSVEPVSTVSTYGAQCFRSSRSSDRGC